MAVKVKRGTFHQMLEKNSELSGTGGTACYCCSSLVINSGESGNNVRQIASLTQFFTLLSPRLSGSKLLREAFKRKTSFIRDSELDHYQ